MGPGRQQLESARRVIVKIGSRSLAGGDNVIADICRQVSAQQDQGRTFLIVSSGAIALGCERLGYKERPKEIEKLQAAAAAGQSVLMHRYEENLAAAGKVTAQVLLTHADLADRVRLNNARQAFGALFDAGAIPIVNENDTVATDEIRFGDNDQLASMIVPLVGADVVLLLTDVEGVLDEHGERLSVFSAKGTLAERASTGPGTGGIRSKVDAAHKASLSGASAVIASAHTPDVIARVLAGEDVGTLFEPQPVTLRARKHWIAFTLRPRGTILLDAGAVRAIREQKRSLLPIGVLGLRGQFAPGDSVRLVEAGGGEVGRGLTRMGSMEVARTAGKSSEELASFGQAGDPVVVHRDDLVISD